MRLAPLALAAATLVQAGAARAAEPTPPALLPSLKLGASPRGEAARDLPIVLQADRLRAQPDIETVAEGRVEFRRGGLVILAERLSYDHAADFARATGGVRIETDGQRLSGPQLQLRVQRFEGFFETPEFEFTGIGSRGRAERLEFLGNRRSRAVGAEYTSCPREPRAGEEPAWLLRTDRVELDLERNEGVAEGAVLRFLGTPILALPTLSFPLSDARKSGWLPPSISTDNRSGVELNAPYYWNIAPNRDATLTPRLITRRGLGLDGEFRYLEPGFEGTVQLDWLPRDNIARRSREAALWQHEGRLPLGTRYALEWRHVSDDDWWKDYPGATRSFSPRLLPSKGLVETPFVLAGGEGLAYLRLQRWQVLQGSELRVTSPFERTPQIGVRLAGREPHPLLAGTDWALEAEFNRFSLPDSPQGRADRRGGDRAHLLAQLGHRWREPGWWIAPRLSLNAAAYAPYGALADGRQRTSRLVPGLRIDAGLELERSTRAFGRAFRQTLEPRLLYARTPFRDQSDLPNYDAAAKDFNFVSLFSDNPFSGVDRVADANQITAGVITRYLDASSGAEALRLGLVQRYQFATQRLSAGPDGSPGGPPQTRRLSDALLIGSTTLVPAWTLDAAIQYSPELSRSVRSIVGARWSPGPFRTVGATYRLARGLSEQLEAGWQWPVWRGTTRAGGSGCSGAWYSVGRFNYSFRDSRITDSLLGVEYDAGCWIGRFVAERLSTGRSEATTRLMLQLELVGLSRIGSNPLKALRDNIPGYTLLRDDRRGIPSGTDSGTRASSSP